MRRTLVNGFAALGLLLTLVTLTPVTLWWARALSSPWSDAGGEVLIVLGADEPTNGIIGQSTYWRSVYALRAWHEGKFKTVVVSGGGGVAESMRHFLVASGVPAEAVLVESRSTSTRENALFTRAILERFAGRKVLLTSDFHLLRARRAFEKVGVTVLPRPLPDVLKHGNGYANRWNIFLELLKETGKLAGYWVKGWV